MDMAKTKQELDEMEQSIRYVVQNMPSHEQFLAQYCPAKEAA
jgi:tryptophan halogenase